MRDSGDASLGSTKSFGGFVAGGGSGFAVVATGSGVLALAGAALGLDRVRAISDVLQFRDSASRWDVFPGMDKESCRKPWSIARCGPSMN